MGRTSGEGAWCEGLTTLITTVSPAKATATATATAAATPTTTAAARAALGEGRSPTIFCASLCVHLKDSNVSKKREKNKKKLQPPRTLSRSHTDPNYNSARNEASVRENERVNRESALRSKAAADAHTPAGSNLRLEDSRRWTRSAGRSRTSGSR